MSFRQIFDRVTRIARSGSFDPFEDDFDDELRRAQELIEGEKRREEEAREAEHAGLRADEPQSGASGVDAEEPEANGPESVPGPEIERALLLLGVNSTASLQEITLAYRRRIVEIHPDRHQSGDASEMDESKLRTQELNRAYALVKEWRAGRD